MKLMIKRIISISLIGILAFSLVGCNVTEFKEGENLIEASELVSLLSESNTVVIDARSEEEYNNGHLQGAINLPPSLLTVSEPVSGMIASKSQVEKVLGEHGISLDSKVYIYDNEGGVFASRVWWVLKSYGHETVKVINNGEKAIVALSPNQLKLTLEVPQITPVEYIAKELDLTTYASIDEVNAVVTGQKEARIIDVRTQAEFDEGAIPTAILYPHTKNLYNDGSFRSGRDIYLDYNDLGIDKDVPVILYCKTSFRATQTLLLLKEAGYNNVKVYDGAWLEWSTKGMITEEKSDEKVTPSASDGS
jgi:thiosulfate/3-mercaptopyruvate sulfurtransferase